MSFVDQYLTVKNWFMFNSVILFLFGIGALLMPENLSSSYDLTLEDGGILAVQNNGAFFLGVGILLWLGRNDGPSDTQKGIMYGMLLIYVLSLILSIRAVMNDVVNNTGWTDVILNLIISTGWGYLLFVKSDETQ
ncbi:MAG: hypothetical protein HeimC2_10740 [Candidatus Heimdallarchaeota archaeon LC_2]|nr:MAG: hypothetical protein HeimC2_10740 [Candidatus Heimdallarchaeota archaeon LC_2]